MSNIKHQRGDACVLTPSREAELRALAKQCCAIKTKNNAAHSK